jgi:hypothetical protein
MCYTLPKIWCGRVQKFWDKTLPMPSSYPVTDSKFSLSYESEDIRDAVVEMEDSIGTEDCPVVAMLPEDTYLAGYVGTYDVSGPVDEMTLLSPEPVSSSNVIAMHYIDEEWVQVEDVEVRDGFVYGTLESFSPIAIFEYAKDIHVDTESHGIAGAAGKDLIVCEGNHVKVYRDKEDNKTYVLNLSSGTKIELTKASYIIGGSVDGSYIAKTSILVENLVTNALACKFIAGSAFTEKEGFAEVGEVNLTVYNSPVTGCLTGSYGAVRTKKANFHLENTILAWCGCGEGYAGIDTENPDFSSKAWCAEANWTLINVKNNLTFLGQNCEYYYVDKTTAYIEGGKHDYLILGGSNSRTNKTSAVVKGAKVGIFQTTNRGNVADAQVKFSGCNVDHLYVGGDASDPSVTGTTTKLLYEIDGAEGTYNFENGTENGVLLTKEDVERIVDRIEVSRNATVTMDDSLRQLLGSKFIEK